jgi:ribosomal protein S18 acetylase RimI-like enzyme/putative sterol carrier protein
MVNKFEYRLRTYKDEDDAAIVELFKLGFGRPNVETANIEGWNWRSKLDPNFHPSNILVAEKDGKIIGCQTIATRDYKISSSLVVKAAGDGIVVHPDYRRRGIGKALTYKLWELLRKKGVIILFGFVPPEIYRRVWKPIYSVAVPTDTTIYTKFLSCKPLKLWLPSINKILEKDNRLASVNLTMVLHLDGALPFTLEIREGKVDIKEHQISNPNVSIEGDFNLILSIIKGRRGRELTLLKALLMRKIKVKGLLRNIFKLYICFKALKAAYTRAL